MAQERDTLLTQIVGTVQDWEARSLNMSQNDPFLKIMAWLILLTFAGIAMNIAFLIIMLLEEWQKCQ